MTRQVLAPSTALYPVPAIMASCGDINGVKNIITLAWAGTVCSEPPMLAIGVRPSRFSHELIKKSGEFVVNLPTVHEAHALDLCGVISGKDVDKFLRAKLTPLPASKVRAPLIAECPVNIECVVRHTYLAGSHEVFIGEIVAVNVDTERTDKGLLKETEALTYHARGYYSLKDLVGTHGFSLKKK